MQIAVGSDGLRRSEFLSRSLSICWSKYMRLILCLDKEIDPLILVLELLEDLVLEFLALLDLCTLPGDGDGLDIFGRGAVLDHSLHFKVVDIV